MHATLSSSAVTEPRAARRNVLADFFLALDGAIRAARTFEELSHLSDAALARRGLKRSDIASIAVRSMDL